METTKDTTAGELLDQMWDKLTEYVRRIDAKKGVRLNNFESWLFWEIPSHKGVKVILALAIMRLKEEKLVSFREDRRGVKWMMPVR